MPKYNKTYPYLLSFLHPSVQAYYIIHKHHIETQKTYVFGQLIQTSIKFCHRKIVLEHFLENYENKKYKCVGRFFNGRVGTLTDFFFF